MALAASSALARASASSSALAAATLAIFLGPCPCLRLGLRFRCRGAGGFLGLGSRLLLCFRHGLRGAGDLLGLDSRLFGGLRLGCRDPRLFVGLGACLFLGLRFRRGDPGFLLGLGPCLRLGLRSCRRGAGGLLGPGSCRFLGLGFRRCKLGGFLGLGPRLLLGFCFRRRGLGGLLGNGPRLFGRLRLGRRDPRLLVGPGPRSFLGLDHCLGIGHHPARHLGFGLVCGIPGFLLGPGARGLRRLGSRRRGLGGFLGLDARFFLGLGPSGGAVGFLLRLEPCCFGCLRLLGSDPGLSFGPRPGLLLRLQPDCDDPRFFLDLGPGLFFRLGLRCRDPDRLVGLGPCRGSHSFARRRRPGGFLGSDARFLFPGLRPRLRRGCGGSRQILIPGLFVVHLQRLRHIRPERFAKIDREAVVLPPRSILGLGSRFLLRPAFQGGGPVRFVSTGSALAPEPADVLFGPPDRLQPVPLRSRDLRFGHHLGARFGHRPCTRRRDPPRRAGPAGPSRPAAAPAPAAASFCSPHGRENASRVLAAANTSGSKQITSSSRIRPK